jgi:hypothetical protein
LAVSRSIVEAHGGRLWADNNKAGGAIFNVTLPLSHTSPKTTHIQEYASTRSVNVVKHSLLAHGNSLNPE